MMTQINALVFRRKFGKILDRVIKKHETIVISRADKPLVVLSPYDLYVPMQEKEERRKRLQKAAQEMNAWAARNGEALRGINAVSAIREIRDSR